MDQNGHLQARLYDKRGEGFSAIEMLVVLGLIAIMATMAIPSYIDRIIRQQIENSLPLADVAKGPVAAAWAATQTFPADNAAAALPPADKIVSNFVSEVAVVDGAINIKFGNRARDLLKGKILTLRPAVVEDAPIVPVAWICAKADVPAKMTVKGVDKTDIDPSFLPLACRSLKKQ